MNPTKNGLSKPIKLLCKSVWYYSPLDENMFFTWIEKIPVITHYDGIKDELYLYIKTEQIDDQNLKELIALFYRYKINMKQLAIFLNDSNKEWFYDNKKAYWHKKIFGS